MLKFISTVLVLAFTATSTIQHPAYAQELLSPSSHFAQAGESRLLERCCGALAAWVIPAEVAVDDGTALALKLFASLLTGAIAISAAIAAKAHVRDLFQVEAAKHYSEELDGARVLMSLEYDNVKKLIGALTKKRAISILGFAGVIILNLWVHNVWLLFAGLPAAYFILKKVNRHIASEIKFKAEFLLEPDGRAVYNSGGSSISSALTLAAIIVGLIIYAIIMLFEKLANPIKGIGVGKKDKSQFPQTFEEPRGFVHTMPPIQAARRSL